MEDTVEEITRIVLREIRHYGYCDQYTILDEVCRRLQSEGENALKMEYFMEDTEDE